MGMREILFRGKRLCLNEWVEGYFVRAKMYRSDEELCEYISIPHPETEGMPSDMFLVDPDTIGQFVGLTDKNGKKIFEGDIIKFHKFRYEPDWTGVVQYENCTYMAVGQMPLAYEKRIDEKPTYYGFEVVMSGIDKTTIEVIGNIHDNPELLEGREGE